MGTSCKYARGTKMKETMPKEELEKERNERLSFFELLDLIDFRDDLRYK